MQTTFAYSSRIRTKGRVRRCNADSRGAQGEIVIIQDADLEYDPADYHKRTAPIEEGRADVVYGSRFLGGPHRVLFFWHYVGNKFLTTISNMVTNLNLSDVWTCYKAFKREVLQTVDLRENGFGFEQEVTIKVARGGWRVYETPIAYYGRTYAEGKKISWRDGVRAIWCILRYGLLGAFSKVRQACCSADESRQRTKICAVNNGSYSLSDGCREAGCCAFGPRRPSFL